MTKTQLIAAVAQATGLSKKAAMEAVDAVFSTVAAALKKGQEVKVMNFGKFVVVNVKASKRMNPRTKAVVQVPAHKAPRWRASSVLKKAVR
ncbi:HU family DNA-binding protein [Candidatus Dojkabacteria bacterium]|nr:HU family DNA-binding protein [Candidatus Dojkabacteria bacterium]